MKVSSILKTLQASPVNEPASVDLANVRGVLIQARKNPYRNGLGIHVIASDGESYGVTGFKTVPSEAALASAIEAAKDYIKQWRIA